MIRPTNPKKIHQNIQYYSSSAYHLDHHNAQPVFRGRSKKNQQISNNRIHNEDIVLQTVKKISNQLKEQRRIFQENRERLLKKIEEYYIQISQKLESQRSEVERSLKQQFNRAVDMLNQHEKKIHEVYNQFNLKRKKHKILQIDSEKIANIEIPVITFHEAKFQSLDCLVTAFHPFIEISAPGTTNIQRKSKKIVDENKNLKPPFSYKTAKCENSKENNQKVVAHLNAFKKSAPLLDSEQECKTVVKGKEDFLLCEEEVSEWKYESFKAKKGVSVEEIIAEESQSKQSSLLSQELS